MSATRSWFWTIGLVGLVMCFSGERNPVDAQVKTELKPLVIENPTVKEEPRYYLDIEGIFGSRGIVVRTVFANSPLRRMKRADRPNSTFAAEPNDLIVAIKDGRGRFIVPTTTDVFAAIVNTLPGPQTQVLIADVRGTGSWVYSVSLKPSGKAPPPPRSGGKIVVILAGDTQDRSVGKSVQGVISGMETMLDRKSQKKQVRQIVKIVGTDFRRQSILNTINRISVHPDDTLLCFINCHGAFDRTLGAYANGHYFAVPGSSMSRKTLRDSLVLKGAKLTCLISESCNVYHPLPRSKFFVESIITDANPKFDSLFLGPRGIVDFNSSATGEYSWTGIFGPMLREALSDSPSRGFLIGADGKDYPAFPRTIKTETRTTWKDFITELRAGTSARYRVLRDSALASRETSEDNKKALRNQTNQTVTVYELPR